MKTNRHAAFTLMELMISVALALVLILGINEVFGLTAKAVGAGQALSSAYQADRGTEIVMANDFKNMVNTAPLLITSQVMPAFRSYQDSLLDQDGKPSTVDPAGTTLVTIPSNVLHYRNHWLSTIAFCSRDLYQRQTGGVSGAFLTPSSSYEAYIWYGHVKQSTTGNGDQNPGGTGNLYASQWVLGRMAMLFQQTTTLGYVSGLEYTSPALSPSPITGYQVQQSRLDVVSGTVGASTNEGTIDAFTASIWANDGAANWWGGTSSSNISSPAYLNYRFQCAPQPARPLTSDAAAYYAPSFVTGCSQFCVEFAGDFVSQNAADGSVNTSGPPGPDGTVDFRMVNGTRQIMWYGMPRSVVGDGQVLASWNSNRPDVNTVQTIWGPTGALPTGATGQPQPYTFEKMLSTNSTNSANPANPMTYIAAWHPKETNNPRPKLIRITWAVDDPNNRLGLPVTFEYVFPVP